MEGNKKKKIIISSIVICILAIGLISLFVISTRDNVETNVDNESNTVKNVAENISSSEFTSENVTTEEPTTEELTTEELTTEEPTTEEPTTEQPTTSHKELETYIDENGVPQFKLETPTTKENATYKYAEDINGIDDAIAYFKSLGYKLGDYDTLTEEQIRTIYKDFSKSLSKEEFEDALAFDKYITLAVLAKNSLPSNPNAPTTTTTTNNNKTENQTTSSSYQFVEDSYVKLDKEETTQKKEDVDKTSEIKQWIKDKYGDKFVYNNLTYVYNYEDKYYYVYKKTEPAHMMTSSTTSKFVTIYKGDSLKTINQMGLILGCPSALEKNEWGLGFGGNTIFDENLESVSFKANTEKYIKKSGCEEQISYWCNWQFMTTEGIPVDVYDDGYIYVDVLYLNSTEKVREKFTIEEYYEFLNKYADKYYIEVQTSKIFVSGVAEDVIDKWVIIKE